MKDFTIIGSVALKCAFKDRFRSPKNDIDILVRNEQIKEEMEAEKLKIFGTSDITNELVTSKIKEIENSKYLTHIPPQYLHLRFEYHNFGDITEQIITDANYLVTDEYYTIAAPSVILQIKQIHIGWDIFWEKHSNDIIFLLNSGIRAKNFQWKKALFDWHLKKHGKKWASLSDKTEDQFFKDSVKRIYNHDDIHEAVAWYDEPLYIKYLKNPNSVACDKNKFDNLSHLEKIRAVKEEIIVTALERYLIPNEFKFSWNLAYYYSFRKLCTTMSSGWFKEFIIENYLELYKNTDWSPIERFNTALEEGKIRLEEDVRSMA